MRVRPRAFHEAGLRLPNAPPSRPAAGTSYRPTHWAWPELAVAGGCVVALVVLFALAPADALYSPPYPRLTPPDFDPTVGLALLALVTPALSLPRRAAPPATPLPP